MGKPTINHHFQYLSLGTPDISLYHMVAMVGAKHRLKLLQPGVYRRTVEGVNVIY